MRLHRLHACLLVAALLLGACDKPRPPAKVAQNVKLLPDTPPPPPPKLEEKRVEPRKEDRPQPQLAQPRPAAAPEPQALKTDEAPGQGAGNGLAAGAVTQDYQGGTVGSGNGGGNSAADRLAANSYAQAATRALNDYLLREKNLRLADYRLVINVWLQSDGRLQRAELVGSSGDSELDSAVRDALQRFPGLGSPLPERMPQPLRLRVSNRIMG
jgi:protein TonB